MLLPMSPTSSLFLMAESRDNPMHVASLQLFQPPDGATALDVRHMFEKQIEADEVAPIFQKRARRSVTSLGQWGWERDTRASTSSTTCGAAPCRSRGGSATCWCCARGCTRRCSTGTARCGRCT